MTIKAIQTQFKGYHFRSRLEARWAVFFDALGLEWEYEPEGFDLGGGVYYLPDFKVTNTDGCYVWYEVKGDNVIGCEKFKKFKDLVDSARKDIRDPMAVMLTGDPYTYVLKNDNKFVAVCPRCGLLHDCWGYEWFPEWRGNSTGFSFGCSQCDGHTPCGIGDEESGLLCSVTPYKGMLHVNSEDFHWVYLPKIKSACIAARSARFEHGESGATL